jgi:hypothetical protein
LVDRLDRFKADSGLSSRTAAIAVLLEGARESSPPAISFEEVLALAPSPEENEGPFAIIGPPRSGKSTTLWKLADRMNAQGIPYIFFDTVNEQARIPKHMNYLEFMGYRFKGLGQFRVIFPPDAKLRRTAMASIVDLLEREIGEERLAKYVLLFEEAFEFSDLRPFKKLLVKIRKSARKTVVVSVEPDPFRNVCTLRRPLPMG